MRSADSLLRIRNLEVATFTEGTKQTILDGFDLDIRQGEVLGVIGETGAGKSISAWAAIGLLPETVKITEGSLTWRGTELVGADPSVFRAIRGQDIGIITQNPVTSLNPFLTVGQQIVRVIRAHERVSRKAALDRAIRQLQSVGFPDAEERQESYPHQLSGGMAQRALIALAMVSRPALLIADEPTTGLDVTIQADILDLIFELVTSAGTSVWLITHDMGVVARLAHRVAVMFAGQIIETGPTRTVFEDPKHPYTNGLIQALTAAQGERLAIDGPPPDLTCRPIGCQFRYRCPWRTDGCATPMPLAKVGTDHSVRCIVAADQNAHQLSSSHSQERG